MKIEIRIEHWKYGVRHLIFEDEVTYKKQKDYYMKNRWKVGEERICQ